jgi:MFS transporter, OFA family, oxalate/formate antiporter
MVYRIKKHFNPNRPFAPSRSPIFYGWFILIASTLGLLLSAPGQTIGVSVFTDYLIEDLKLSRFHFSLAYTMGTIMSALLINRAGRLMDRYGSRFIAVVTVFSLGMILLYMSQIDHITSWFAPLNGTISTMIFLIVGFLFMRFLGQGVLTMASKVMLMNWFDEKRGFVNSLMGTFFSPLFSLSPLFFAWLIGLFGWQNAWLSMGIVLSTVMSIVIWSLFRDTPEACGLLPDGKPHSDPHKTRLNQEKSWTIDEAKQTWTFWMFNLSLAMFSLYITAVTFHVVSIFEVAGWEREKAISIFFPTSILAVILNLIAGYLSDKPYFKANLKWFNLFFLLGLLTSAIGVLALKDSTGYWLIIIGNSMASGMFALLSTISWPRYFGRKFLGGITGYNVSWMVFFSAIGPSLFGWSYDVTGNYFGATVVCLVFLTGLFAGNLKANKPIYPENE